MDEDRLLVPAPLDNVLDLDAALRGLAEHDARKASILELHVFGGLTYEETARMIELSPRR